MGERRGNDQSISGVAVERPELRLRHCDCGREREQVDFPRAGAQRPSRPQGRGPARSGPRATSMGTSQQLMAAIPLLRLFGVSLEIRALARCR